MGPSFLGYYENSVFKRGNLRAVGLLPFVATSPLDPIQEHACEYRRGRRRFFCFLVGRPLELFFLQAQTAEAVYLHGKNALVSYPIPPMHTIKELPISGECSGLWD